ncbi:hypothetical protein AGMMS49990_00810 [Endomicrobiia bacterium]|nr:hypothetical protein AGMMS49990_00810 [Endomicrobiia bacterium]
MQVSEKRIKKKGNTKEAESEVKIAEKYSKYEISDATYYTWKTKYTEIESHGMLDFCQTKTNGLKQR